MGWHLAHRCCWCGDRIGSRVCASRLRARRVTGTADRQRHPQRLVRDRGGCCGVCDGISGRSSPGSSCAAHHVADCKWGGAVWGLRRTRLALAPYSVGARLHNGGLVPWPLAGRVRCIGGDRDRRGECHLPPLWDHLFATSMGPPWRVIEDARWGRGGQVRGVGAGGTRGLPRPACELERSIGRWPIGPAVRRWSWSATRRALGSR